MWPHNPKRTEETPKPKPHETYHYEYKILPTEDKFPTRRALESQINSMTATGKWRLASVQEYMIIFERVVRKVH